MKYLVILALLALGACAGTPETRGTNALAIACDSFATGLDQLVPLRKAKKISASNEARVDAAIAAVKPVCSKDAVVDPAQAIGIVKEGINLLNQIKSSI